MATGKTADSLRTALTRCGYDIDDVMTNRTHRREYADLRSIVWSIYQSELCKTPGQVGRAFRWCRSTVYSALIRTRQLRETNPPFAAKYDMIYGYFLQDKEKRSEAK